jgi:hypothetical protein
MKVLGLLHVGYGFLLVLGSYGVVFLTRHAGHWIGVSRYQGSCDPFFESGGMEMLRFFTYNLMGLMALVGVVGIVAGCGLLGHKNWARIMVMVLGIIALLNFPFGTALGVYTLLVVLKPEAKELTAS